MSERCCICNKEIFSWLESSDGSIFCSEECFKDTWPKCCICGNPMDRWIESEEGKQYCSVECREYDLPKCCICGNPMDHWTESEEGKKYCSENCYRKSWPRCEICGNPMDHWIEVEDGKKYCVDGCYEKSLPTCMVCGKHMKNWYASSDGKKYCSNECYQETWPKCEVCGIHMDSWIINENGKKFCSEKCFEQTWPLCAVCGKSMDQWIEAEDGKKYCSDSCFEQMLPHCETCGEPMRNWIITDGYKKYCSNECLYKTDDKLTIKELAYLSGLNEDECLRLTKQNNWDTDEAYEKIDMFMQSLNGNIEIEAGVIEGIRNAGIYNKLANNLSAYNTLRGGKNGFKGFVFEELHAADAASKGEVIQVLSNNSIADFVIYNKDGSISYAQAKSGYNNQVIDWGRYKDQTIVVDKGNTALAKRAREAGLKVVESDVSKIQSEQLAKLMQLESKITGNSTASIVSQAYSLNQAGIRSAKFAAKIGVGVNIGSNIFDVLDGEKDLAEATVSVVKDTATVAGVAYASGIAITAAGSAVSTLTSTTVGSAAIVAAETAGGVIASTTIGGTLLATGGSIVTTAGTVGASIASAPLLPLVAGGVAAGFVFKGLKKLFS